ncbi:hypothetical protein EDC94DRAFT_584818 [Helicostylum pulchrum]|nr:hypothetical protein EDC94DRAFT_584818 [Helicostylum pulchrum]
MDLKKYYQKKELQKRVEDNQEQSYIQYAETASALIFEKKPLGGRRSDNTVVEDEEVTIETIGSTKKHQYSFVKNGKRFDYHTPSQNLISHKKPALNQGDHGSLRDLFEIRLSSGSKNYCMKIIEMIKTEMCSSNVLWALPEEGKFIDMMRHVLTDYYQGCRKSTPINTNQERAFFFCEAIVPMNHDWKPKWLMVKLYADMMVTFSDFDMIGARSNLWSRDVVSGINKKLLDGIFKQLKIANLRVGSALPRNASRFQLKLRCREISLLEWTNPCRQVTQVGPNVMVFFLAALKNQVRF